MFRKSLDKNVISSVKVTDKITIGNAKVGKSIIIYNGYRNNMNTFIK